MCQKDVGNQSDKQGREVACCFLVIINHWLLFLECLNVIAAVRISKNKQIEKKSWQVFNYAWTPLFLVIWCMPWRRGKMWTGTNIVFYNDTRLPLWHFSFVGRRSFPSLTPIVLKWSETTGVSEFLVQHCAWDSFWPQLCSVGQHRVEEKHLSSFLL